MKNIALCLLFLLVGTAVYAQTAGTNGRQPRVWDQAVSSVKLQSGGTDYTDNTSVFTNVAVVGNQATGNVGYITFTSQDGAGNIIDYYLWMDATTKNGTVGQLKMASFGLLASSSPASGFKLFASFPYGDWRAVTGFASAGYDVAAL